MCRTSVREVAQDSWVITCLVFTFMLGLFHAGSYFNIVIAKMCYSQIDAMCHAKVFSMLEHLLYQVLVFVGKRLT